MTAGSPPSTQPVKEPPAQRTCQQCGHLCDRVAEFHPYLFCQLKRAGVDDPWVHLRMHLQPLGVKLPMRPPLVRDLPVIL